MRLLSDVRTDSQSIRKYIRGSYFYLIKEGNDLREATPEEIEERRLQTRRENDS